MDKRKAIVTGAGSGIGREVAKRLAKRGLFVHVLGKSEHSINETVRLIGKNKEAEAHRVDITDSDAMKRIIEEIGSVSVFVANAGICEKASLGDANATAVFERVMATNLHSVWSSFKLIEPHLEQGASAVVVSSGLGKSGRAGYAAYAASKHAVLGLVKCIALDLASKEITVNAVCPGWVDTKMARNDMKNTSEEMGIDPSDVKSMALRNIPLGRFVKPDEVAALVDFLTSKEARAITGQSYNISCGEFSI